MSNAKALVKQADLTRYMKAWNAAGYPEPKLEIRPDGTVILVPMDENGKDAGSDWDDI